MNDQNQNQQLLSADDPFWKSDSFRKLNPAARLAIWRERCIDSQSKKNQRQSLSTLPSQHTEEDLYQRQMEQIHWRWAEMLNQQGEAQRQAAAAAEIGNAATISSEPEVQTAREMLRRIKNPVERLARARQLGIK
jgi:mannose-6-phosphate isomerase class I